jgi:glycosyltransferase involved in cell wall biosynthesis
VSKAEPYPLHFPLTSPVSFHSAPAPEGARFSIIIPTWNNLDHAKLIVRSLRMHSAYPHEIILHINDGSDGTLEWAKQEGLAYTHSSTNVGICFAMNAATQLASTDYIAYFNDDMYALPNWDVPMWEAIQEAGTDAFYLSSTVIEPTGGKNPCVIAPQDYGRTFETFREADLLRDYLAWPQTDWQGSTWPPNIVHRRYWWLVGGYSIEFGPGMHSDPDFSAKLWQAGVRYYKGIAASRVYHFQCRSTGRIVKNNGRRTFMRKWDLPASVFFKAWLRRGERWVGPVLAPIEDLKMRFERWRARRA